MLHINKCEPKKIYKAQCMGFAYLNIWPSWIPKVDISETYIAIHLFWALPIFGENVDARVTVNY